MKANRLANVAAAIMLFQPLLALAQTQQAAPWNGHAPWYMWHGGWGFGWIFPLFMFLMMIACAVMVIRGLMSGGRPHCGSWRGADRDPTHTALEVLHERFARGEIQKQEYEDKRAAILSGGAPSQ